MEQETMEQRINNLCFADDTDLTEEDPQGFAELGTLLKKCNVLPLLVTREISNALPLFVTS